MKQLFAIVAVLVLSASLLCGVTLTTAAAPSPDTKVVYDYAGYLSDVEETALTAQAEAYGDALKNNHIIIVVTTNYTSSAEEEARRLGFTSTNDSCFLLAIFVSPTREYEYETYTLGDMSRYISDKEYKKIDLDDTLYDNIKSENLPTACERFISLVGDRAVTMYDPKPPREVTYVDRLIVIGIALALGIAAGVTPVVIIIVRYKKKNKSASYPLQDYTRLYLTHQRDLFLDKSVMYVRVAPSGGGRSGGGGGGRSGGRH